MRKGGLMMMTIMLVAFCAEGGIRRDWIGGGGVREGAKVLREQRVHGRVGGC